MERTQVGAGPRLWTGGGRRGAGPDGRRRRRAAPPAQPHQVGPQEEEVRRPGGELEDAQDPHRVGRLDPGHVQDGPLPALARQVQGLRRRRRRRVRTNTQPDPTGSNIKADATVSKPNPTQYNPVQPNPP